MSSRGGLYENKVFAVSSSTGGAEVDLSSKSASSVYTCPIASSRAEDSSPSAIGPPFPP
eukprot:CAMPEP_0169475764 /NCGR_PEP_ID=MMETSP1042-20121227/26996_1 /TAXON_ID=464988 /ORGANISM="Hemiselmis andersenii, Strain CCMP1180" /LENGTH=58 /DNA_ID=CAMNT_0009589947 /DNA_START=118 /DNA_END=291 /DNA_ORIENTATION=-